MIIDIYIAASRRASQKRMHEIEVHEGKGIVGDRNYGKDIHPGQNITFIEQEVIERYNQEQDQEIVASDTRRNIITKGVRLNELVGKTFRIGSVYFKGVELCEPCSLLGDDLCNPSISRAAVVKAFVGNGGLRADVLNNGVISVGMPLEVTNV